MSANRQATNQEETNLDTWSMRAKQEDSQVVLDLSTLSENDLRTLQTQDPFMYHSIPSVHQARLFLREVDHPEALSAAAASVIVQDHTSRLSSRSSSACSSLNSSLVSRKSRLTTECHINLLIEDDELDEEFFFNDSEEETQAGSIEGRIDNLMGRLDGLSVDEREEPLQ